MNKRDLQMRQLVLSASIGLLLATGCASNETRTTAEPAAASAADTPTTTDATTSVRVASVVPYDDEAKVAANIRQECPLGQQFSEFIAEYGASQGMQVVRQDAVEPGSEGRVLVVELTDAVSGGNAWIGHRKMTESRGTLYDNGEEVASFTARRFSGGGAFAGFKGSCSVLGRTVQAMGRDVATWARLPTDGQHLGD